MATRTVFMVRPKAAALPVVEEWIVVFPDPETGELQEFDVSCPRGTFFIELPKFLTALGYDPSKFHVEDQDKTWSRELRHTFR